jgi:hypothetical protein
VNVSKRAGVWTLVTTHGMVLLDLAAHADITRRHVSADLGLTERHQARDQTADDIDCRIFTT